MHDLANACSHENIASRPSPAQIRGIIEDIWRESEEIADTML